MKLTSKGLLYIEGADISLPCNPVNYQKCNSRNNEFIGIHWTANPGSTARQNALNWKNNAPKTSAHVICDDLEIYQIMRLCDIGYHVGTKGKYYNSTRNSNSIGIEMCCDKNGVVTKATRNKAAGVTAWLFIQFGWSADEVDTRVVRHWDVTRKWCPASMAGTGNTEWLEFKNLVREKIAAATRPKTAPVISALIYDYDFYLSHNADLRAAGITSTLDVASHFLKYGMKELRQGCETFDPHVYKANNEDLRAAFGDNNEMYYQHYINYGYKENRTHV